MDPKLAALRELLRDPSANYTAVAVAIAALVTFVLAVILTLVAAVMPKRRALAAASDSPPRLGVVGSILIVVVVIAGVTGASALWYQQTSTDEFCAQTCHSMQPATLSWTRSPHGTVSCIRCHESSALSEAPRNAAYRLYYVYREYVSKGPIVPLAVPAARCLNCHQDVLDAKLTARNGDPFTHREALLDGASCRRCHRSQGHEPARK